MTTWVNYRKEGVGLQDEWFERMKRYGLPAWPGMTGEQARTVAMEVRDGVPAIDVSPWELQTLQGMQIRRTAWPLAFSTNGREIWPTVTLGYTPLDLRQDVSGQLPLLDRLAKIYTRARCWYGGRFFIGPVEAYWQEEDYSRCRFAWLNVRED